MLRSKYEKSTDLINHFIITEHKELYGPLNNEVSIGKSIFYVYLYMIINKIKIKNNDKK
jgi:hypothetical protein